MELIQRLTVIGLTIACAICLQGCSVKVPRHKIGNWETEPSYLVQYQFTPPKAFGVIKENKPILNSCSDPAIALTMVCSGHGRCKDWHDGAIGETAGLRRLSFCECDPEWADPECRTPRKSQQTAYLLSVFLGPVGADQFYLGFPSKGIFKLLTVGGFGLLWLYDICRIGSHPPNTNSNFRVSGDLPHYAFVLSAIIMMLTLGFFIAIRSIQANRIKKAHELMLMRMEQQNEEDILKNSGVVDDEDDVPAVMPGLPPAPGTVPLGYGGMPGYSSAAQVPLNTAANFTGYGSTLPQAGAGYGSTSAPATGGPAYNSRSFKPAETMAPLTPVAQPTLPPRAAAPVASTLSPRGSVRSMPATEYSPQGSRVYSPNSAVLPAVQGLPPVTTAVTAPPVRPVTTMPTAPNFRPVSTAATAPAVRPVSSAII